MEPVGREWWVRKYREGLGEVASLRVETRQRAISSNTLHR